MGINLWQDNAELAAYQSAHGHQVRTLSIEGGTDYTFAAEETAEQVLSRVAVEFPVDIFLCGCPELYPPPLQIEHAPVRTVAVISDWNLYQPQLEHNLARFDVVLSDKRGSHDLVVECAKPLYWGPVYSHRPRVHRDLGLARDIDIGYFGNLNPAGHPRRHRLLEQISTLSPRWRVEVSGGHSQEDYASLLNRTRIAFNCSIRGEMNLRCFEAPACGALLFMEEDNLETPDIFTHGENAVFYNDDNFMELLTYYLEHEEESAAIARAGQALIESMSAVKRLDSFIDFIAAAPESGRPFHHFDKRTKAQANGMLYSSALPAEQHAVAHGAIDAWLTQYPDDAAAHMAHGCFAYDAAVWNEGEARKQWYATAAREFERAALLAPEDCTPAYNLGVVLLPLKRELALPHLERAQRLPTTRLGPYALGQRSDPHYIDLRWRLALGHDAAPAVHSMAQASVTGVSG